MKKSLLIIVSVLLIISTVGVFNVVGCKASTAEEATAEEATAEEATAEEATAEEATAEEKPVIPTVQVKWAHSAYIDCSVGIVGMEKGFFEEVGIEIEDPNILVQVENAGAFLDSGSADFVNAGGLLQMAPSLKNIPEVRTFIWHDLFLGSCLMGQPNYKSTDEFIEEGFSVEEAMEKAVAQMKGKTLLLAVDPASTGLAKSFLKAGGLELSDVNTIIADDKTHVPTMLAGKADFEQGGGPTIIAMLKNGFKQIITTANVIKNIDPEKDISPLTAACYNGVSTLSGYMEENPETVYRVASVIYRIIDYITKNPDDAAAIQTPWLNRYGGSSLDVEDTKIIYEKIDPFVGFYEQNEWYFDESSSLYWEYWVSAILDAAEESGVIEEGKWTPENVNASHNMYYDLENYRKNAENLINQHKDEINDTGGIAKEFLDAAEHQYSIFNFYDADRFAKEAVKLMER